MKAAYTLTAKTPEVYESLIIDAFRFCSKGVIDVITDTAAKQVVVEFPEITDDTEIERIIKVLTQQDGIQCEELKNGTLLVELKDALEAERGKNFEISQELSESQQETEMYKRYWKIERESKNRVKCQVEIIANLMTSIFPK